MGRDLLGYIDVVEPGRVTDFKSGRRTISQREVDVSLQFNYYSLVAHRDFGVRPTFRLDHVKEGSETGRVIIAPKVEANYNQFLDRCRETVRAIDAGIFPPCHPKEWWCSKRFCGYSAICPYYVKEADK